MKSHSKINDTFIKEKQSKFLKNGKLKKGKSQDTFQLTLLVNSLESSLNRNRNTVFGGGGINAHNFVYFVFKSVL